MVSIPAERSHGIAHGRLGGPTTVLVDLVVPGPIITLEHLDLLGRHQPRNHIGLDLLELEAEPFVRVILLVRLILVVQDKREVGVFGRWVNDERDEGVDGSLLRNEVEGPSLSVSEITVENRRWYVPACS